MSDNLASLRNKIAGATKLESVVRTMKAVAASSIGQYETAVRSLADYEHSVNLGLSVCFRQGVSGIRATRKGKLGVIVFGSDQGLVGQFNERVAELVESKLETLPGEKIIWAVGERIASRLIDANLQTAGVFPVPDSVAEITPLVGQLQAEVLCEEVVVFHTKPGSGEHSEPICRRLLPLDAEWQRDLEKLPWPTKMPPEVVGGSKIALHAFIREYLFISLFKACAESSASEHASRLAAMQRAEKNIDSLLTRLNSTFYRLRQSSIDEELFDVIAGFNALSQSGPRIRNNVQNGAGSGQLTGSGSPLAQSG